MATSGCPGPVHLQFAGEEGELDEAETEMQVICEPTFGKFHLSRPRSATDATEAAAARLAASDRPIIVAGGGVIASDAAPALIALAEAPALPGPTSLNGKGSIPGNHPLSVGVVGRILGRPQTAS